MSNKEDGAHGDIRRGKARKSKFLPKAGDGKNEEAPRIFYLCHVVADRIWRDNAALALEGLCCQERSMHCSPVQPPSIPPP